MTATGALHLLTSMLDTFRHGRLMGGTAATAAPAAVQAAPAVEMSCPRCGESVKATFPPDEGEDWAFECGRCGGVARWV